MLTLWLKYIIVPNCPSSTIWPVKESYGTYSNILYHQTIRIHAPTSNTFPVPMTSGSFPGRLQTMTHSNHYNIIMFALVNYCNIFLYQVVLSNHNWSSFSKDFRTRMNYCVWSYIGTCIHTSGHTTLWLYVLLEYVFYVIIEYSPTVTFPFNCASTQTTAPTAISKLLQYMRIKQSSTSIRTPNFI